MIADRGSLSVGATKISSEAPASFEGTCHRYPFAELVRLGIGGARLYRGFRGESCPGSKSATPAAQVLRAEGRGSLHAATRAVIFFFAFVAVMPALADPSAERGREIFWAKCVSCHSFGCNRNGPKLEGVIGRRAGTVTDFSNYSDALKTSGIVWSTEQLDRFLTDPTAMIPDVRQMNETGLPIESPKDRSDLISFLKSGDTSYDICPS